MLLASSSLRAVCICIWTEVSLYGTGFREAPECIKHCRKLTSERRGSHKKDERCMKMKSYVAEHKKSQLSLSLLIHPELRLGIPLVFLVKRGIAQSLTGRDWHLLPPSFLFCLFVLYFHHSFCLPASTTFSFCWKWHQSTNKYFMMLP